MITTGHDFQTGEVVTAEKLNDALNLATLDSGATAARPVAPAAGELFFDTDLDRLLVYDGAAWQVCQNAGDSVAAALIFG